MVRTSILLECERFEKEEMYRKNLPLFSSYYLPIRMTHLFDSTGNFTPEKSLWMIDVWKKNCSSQTSLISHCLFDRRHPVLKKIDSFSSAKRYIDFVLNLVLLFEPFSIIKEWVLVNEFFALPFDTHPLVKYLGGIEHFLFCVYSKAKQLRPDCKFWLYDISPHRTEIWNHIVKVVPSEVDGIGIQCRFDLGNPPRYPDRSWIKNNRAAYWFKKSRFFNAVKMSQLNAIISQIKKNNKASKLCETTIWLRQEQAQNLTLQTAQEKLYKSVIKLANDTSSDFSFWNLQDGSGEIGTDSACLFDHNWQPKIWTDSVLKCLS